MAPADDRPSRETTKRPIIHIAVDLTFVSRCSCAMCSTTVLNQRPIHLLSPFVLLFRFHVVMGDVLFSTKPSSSYDFAVVQLRDSAPEVVVPVVAKSFQPGGVKEQSNTGRCRLLTTLIILYFIQTTLHLYYSFFKARR